MKKSFKQLASCLLTAALVTTSITVPSASNTAEAATVTTLTTSPARVSVHDPSITEATDGYYYVFGSHIDAARSKDLVNWQTFTNGYTEKNNVLFDDLSANLSKAFAWAGENDMDAKDFSVWAPDVFWNADYVNEDGSKGAYMIYFCTTSTYKRSVLAYGVSQNISGPYKFVDTLIYSGFTKNSTTDFGSKINTQYTNTNIDELIEAGKLEGLNDSWFSNDAYNTSYAPNAIDPTVFYDKDGRLWMTYGSWSGGIFVLEIDPATGQAIYPGKSSVTEDGLTVDAYFGTRIGGGYTKSGEGPYILYDKESDYYYLYMSYETLTVNASYNMRLFRSKNPDGPYLDAAGNNAALPKKMDHNNIGIKVMGNYNLSGISRAYKAEGHNSALIDSDGQRYLVYHTRFDNWGETHQVRVHQQFINEAGWPVTAVFENKGDTISETGYAKEDIIGEYEYINHGLDNDGSNVHQPETIKLNADGTVSGAVTGTWEAKDGTYYMNAVIGGVTYSGVFFLQHNESESNCEKVMTFTAIGTNNMTIWGARKETYNYSEEEVVERASNDLDSSMQIKEKTTSNLTLPTEGFHDTVITWASSDTAVVANDGTVTRPEADTKITLTATLTKGNATATKTYTTTVMSKNIKPDFKYDFESVTDKKVAGSGTDTTEAVLNGTATVTNTTFAGNVLTIKSDSGSKGKNYLALPADVFKNVGESGFTISMWAKFNNATAMDSALFEAKSSSGTQNLPAAAVYAGGFGTLQTSEAYLNGVIGITPDSNTWNLITCTVSANGITTYVNGAPLNTQQSDLTNALLTETLSQIDDVRIGGGTLLSSEDVANASIDNVEFYSVALSADEIYTKYSAEKDAYPNMSLDANRSTIYVGGDTNNTAQISVETDASMKYTAVYTSSDESVASVNSSGKVTAKKAGTATITVTLTSGDKTQKLTKKITVKKAFLKLSKKKTSLKVKKSFTFKAKGYGLKANSVKWTSSKPAVLSINKKTGKATAKKAGTTKITAKYKKYSVSVNVKVK